MTGFLRLVSPLFSLRAASGGTPGPVAAGKKAFNFVLVSPSIQSASQRIQFAYSALAAACAAFAGIGGLLVLPSVVFL